MSPSAALTDVLVKSQQTSKSHCEVYTQLRKRQFQYFYPPVDEHRVVPYSMSASIWCSTSPSCSSFHVQYFLSCKFSFFLPITRSYTYSGVVFQRGDGFYISGSQIYHTTCHHSKYTSTTSIQIHAVQLRAVYEEENVFLIGPLGCLSAVAALHLVLQPNSKTTQTRCLCVCFSHRYTVFPEAYSNP